MESIERFRRRAMRLSCGALLALLILQGACAPEKASPEIAASESVSETARPAAQAADSAPEPCTNPLADVDIVAEIDPKDARHLSSACVDDLFQRVAQACETQNGAMLLSQITPEYQGVILASKPESVSWFEHAAYLCGDMAQIRKSIRSISASPSYGLFQSRKSARLCVYNPNPSRCEGELKVAFEDGKLKLNTH
jgi:hypothetical protein